jgi:replicative DNA helicase
MIEEIIFSQLLTNDNYARIVLPHLKEEYFSTQEEKNFLKIYNHFFIKHNKLPSKQAMLLEIENLKSSAEVYTAMKTLVENTVEFTETLKYLVDSTEKFCKERAVFNALKESVLIVDGQSKTKTAEAIPSILQEALSICFDTSIGHDYFDESSERFDYYHLSESRIPSGIGMIDKITKGGFPRKTLNMLLSPPHGGKTLMMTNIASGALLAGYNVLYISMEMQEKEIGRRFDVNFLDIDFETLEVIPKQTFESKFASIQNKSRGKLVIKEYPTGGAHAGHFRSLLSELRTKQNFIPDMIVVDYLSICSSEKYKTVGNHNSYTITGPIGTELRALAVESDAAVISAIQTNRAGVGNADVDISNTSESMGIPSICDWFLAIINTDELKELNQTMFRQLKNRYAGITDYEKFILGVDTKKQKLFDLDHGSEVANIKPVKQKNSKPADNNKPFDFDMLHTIKPVDTTFDNFNF